IGSVFLGRRRQEAIGRIKVDLDGPSVGLGVVNSIREALIELRRHGAALHNELDFELLRLPDSVYSGILCNCYDLISRQRIAIFGQGPSHERIAGTDRLYLEYTLIYRIESL